MIATYAPRVRVHPDRYGSTRPLPPLWVVIHTSEGAEGDSAAESLAAYLTRPGDRTTSTGSRYGSSYHAVADTGLRVIPAVEDHRVAYSAPGSNTEGLHIVIPGRAGQTRSQWLAGASAGAITTVAAYLLDVRTRFGIPTERVSAAELRAGTRGYCDHATVRDAFGRTTHWDVGPHFPWDILAAEIRRLSSPHPPPTERPPDMPPTAILIDPKLNGTFAVIGGRWVPWLWPVPTGVPVVTLDHPWTREQILHDQGPTAAALWRKRIN